MSLKEELKELYSSISDYDPKYLRTLFSILINPVKVTYAPKGTYTPALRFTLATISSVFIIVYLFDPSWIESRSVVDFLNVTLREQEYQRVQESISQNYAAYINMVILLPTYFISLKLLFFNKESWYFFYRLSLYQTSALFLLILALFFIQNTLPFSDFLDWFTIGLLILFCIYQFQTLSFNKWYFSIPKATLAIIIASSITNELTPYLFSLTQNLVNPQTKYYDLSPSNNDIITTEIENYSGGSLEQLIIDSDHSVWFSSFYQIGRIKDSKVIWEKYIDPEGNYWSYSYSLLHAPEAELLIQWGFVPESNLIFFTLFSEDGSHYQTFLLDQTEEPDFISLYSDSKNEIQLLKSHNKNELLSFSRLDSIWILNYSPESISDFDSQLIGQIESIPGSTDKLFSVSFRPLSHIASMWIQRRDSTNKIIWEQELYDKKTPFTPDHLLEFTIDTTQNQILSYYTLSEDSMMFVHLQRTDLITGELLANNRFGVYADLVSIESITFDDQNIYLSGQIHKHMVKPFWKPTNHIGYIDAVNYQSLNPIGRLVTGPNNRESESIIGGLVSDGDSLLFYSYEIKNNQRIFFDSSEGLYYKKISISSLNKN
ncbi:MAG: hypothetical protein RLN90_05700 [Balneolaceae bacterium]